MKHLSSVERKVLRYHGQPAKTIAVAEGLRLEEVLEAQAQLRSRGVVGITPYAEPTCTEDQLSFEQMMRNNHAPKASDQELGHTTETDPEGW